MRRPSKLLKPTPAKSPTTVPSLNRESIKRFLVPRIQNLQRGHGGNETADNNIEAGDERSEGNIELRDYGANDWDGRGDGGEDPSDRLVW